VNQLACFDNSLTEIVSNPINAQEKMQQDSPLFTASFISNFHCRYQLNKAEHNKIFSIASKTPTILKDLLCWSMGAELLTKYRALLLPRRTCHDQRLKAIKFYQSSSNALFIERYSSFVISPLANLTFKI